MTALDIFVVLLLGGGMMIGFVRGFAHEVLSLIAWVVGLVALKMFHAPVAASLLDAVGSTAGAAAVAFALVFLPAYLAFKLFARFAGGKARRSVLGPVDRILGGGFGMVKGLIGATLFFLLAHLAIDIVHGRESERPDWMVSSRTYPLLNASSHALVGWVEEQRR